MSKMASILAKLAMSRSRLERAISTARACGDSEYVFNNKASLDLLYRKIDALTRVLPNETIEEAKEITNAPI